MGYDTEFEGSFKLSRRVTPDEFDYMRRFNFTRHEAFDVDKLIAEFGDSRGLKGLGYGERGEYYVSVSDDYCPREERCVLRGASDKSSWCHWKLTDDGTRLVWDEGEKTYDYIHWLRVVIRILTHWGITLSGSVNWHGSDEYDDGNIALIKNRMIVTTIGGEQWDMSQHIFNELELQRTDNHYTWEERFPLLAAHLNEMRTVPSATWSCDHSIYQANYELYKLGEPSDYFYQMYLPSGYVPEFKLSAKPVTVAMWNEYCESVGFWDIRKCESSLPITDIFVTEVMKTPYEDVSVHSFVNHDEFSFCDWIYLIAGYSVTLPTVTQFQHALRVGDTGSYVYPWGIENGLREFPNELASVDRSELVYSNTIGLVDMVGNINHWCADHREWRYADGPCFYLKCGVADGLDGGWAYFNCAFDDGAADFYLSRTGFRLCSNPEYPNGTFEDLSTVISQLNPSKSENTFTSHSDWKVSFPCLAEYITRMCEILGNTFVFGIPVEETVWVDVEDWDDFNDDGEPITKRVSLFHPARDVTLSNFMVGEAPVTVAMWREYCAATCREMPPTPSWGWVDDYPIHVSWYDAMGPYSEGGFCGWATQVSGYALTLPTEAQFEYASSGGEEGVLYPWGNEFSDKLLWCSNRNQRVAPGGVNRSSNIYRNAFGIIDMCGNISQWCLDGDVPYGDSDAINPVRPADDNDRAVRSSSYKSIDPLYMRRCYRGLGDIYRDIHGFRMVINTS